jgi:hypothetical protein
VHKLGPDTTKARFLGKTEFAHPHAHRALKLEPPKPEKPAPTANVGAIRRRERLGGLIHEYY